MSPKPLRRRRLGAGAVAGGASSFGGAGGGNPNEPQEAPHDDHSTQAAASTAEHDHSSTCIVGPLHQSYHHGLAMEDDAKVHDGPGMSFGGALRRTLTSSVHSLRSTPSVPSYSYTNESTPPPRPSCWPQDIGFGNCTGGLEGGPVHRQLTRRTISVLADVACASVLRWKAWNDAPAVASGLHV